MSKKLWRNGEEMSEKGEGWVFFELSQFFFWNKERKRLLRRLDWLIACDPADLIFPSEFRVRTASKFPALAIRTILTINTESNKFCKQYRFFEHEMSEARVPDLN